MKKQHYSIIVNVKNEKIYSQSKGEMTVLLVTSKPCAYSHSISEGTVQRICISLLSSIDREVFCISVDQKQNFIE